jgi:dienelactone hydrolase
LTRFVRKRSAATALCLIVSACVMPPAQAQVAPGASEPKLAADLFETVTKIPVTVALLGGASRSGEMIITHYKPAGAGPFPVVVMSHGRAGDAAGRAKPERQRFMAVTRFWIARGFAVIVPTRLGYGATGVEPDTEYSGLCNNKTYGPMAEAAAHQIRTAVAFAASQPWADTKRIVLMGQSVGGLASTVLNGKNVPGVVAAINMAGGSGGNPKQRPGDPCGADRLTEVYRAAGVAAKTPMLWVYAENDKYWGPDVPRSWHGAYIATGAKAELVMLPPVGEDGHRAIDQPPVWIPHVDRFIASIGLKKN